MSTGWKDFDADYALSGNVLLTGLLGAKRDEYPKDTDMDAAMETIADTLRAAGKQPCVIPGGGSNPVGATGYANCALELTRQAAQIGLSIDHLVHATGSTGTQAGLVAGCHAMQSPFPVLGIGVRLPRAQQEQKVFELACATAGHLGVKPPLPRELVQANCDYVGDGYGIPTEGMREAVSLLARLEGILLDPVYSGKGMAGLIDLTRKGVFSHNGQCGISAHRRFGGVVCVSFGVRRGVNLIAALLEMACRKSGFGAARPLG